MKYHKLVRDKIPEIIEKPGKNTKTRILAGEEFTIELEKKLQEEVQEFLENHEITELVDIQEVILAIAQNLGVSKKELETIRQKKQKERGGFKKSIMLLEVD